MKYLGNDIDNSSVKSKIHKPLIFGVVPQMYNILRSDFGKFKLKQTIFKLIET